MSDVIFICTEAGCDATESVQFVFPPANFSPGDEFVYMKCDQHD